MNEVLTTTSVEVTKSSLDLAVEEASVPTASPFALGLRRATVRKQPTWIVVCVLHSDRGIPPLNNNHVLF